MALLEIQGLTRALAARLAVVLERLPDGAVDALGVLDFAEAAGVVLDLAAAQIAMVRWWQTAHPSPPDEALVRLRDRLGLSPELV